MKKKFIQIFAAVFTLFVLSFSFYGCALVKEHQNSCNHFWVREEDSIEATCSQEGVITYHCLKCQKNRYDSTPKLPHTFNEEESTFEMKCSSSTASLFQKCTVCNEVIKTNLSVECHAFGEPVYHEAYEATLVDLGACSQEDYDKLSAEEIETLKNDYFYALRDFSECAYTERICSECGQSEKIYEHRFDELNQNAFDKYLAESKESGVCDIFSANCYFCGVGMIEYTHDYKEREIIFSSSELIVKRLVCSNCNVEEKYEVQFLK